MRTHARTAQDTEDLGRRLATARPAADAALAVLYLSGELGAGKTTFARGFARALGVQEAVPSPTYTLLELYPAGALTVVHVDLYRVRAPSELESLGLREVGAHRSRLAHRMARARRDASAAGGSDRGAHGRRGGSRHRSRCAFGPGGVLARPALGAQGRAEG